MTNPAIRVRPASSTSASAEFSTRKFTPEERTDFRRRRPAWRQKLVEAERGLTQSLRSDSTLFLHIFLDCLLLASCGVLGLNATHWAIVAAGLSAMLAAELFAQGLRTVAAELSTHARKQTLSISAAAKLLVILGSSLAIGIILWLRCRELFGA